jgi:hypothetical protein
MQYRKRDETDRKESGSRGDGKMSNRIVGFIKSIVKKKTDWGTRVDIEKISRGGVPGIEERLVDIFRIERA